MEFNYGVSFISTKKAAKMSGYTETHINWLFHNDRIPGAFRLDNGIILIPERWGIQMSQKRSLENGHLSVSKAAELTGVTKQAIYLALHQGKIKSIQRDKGKYKGWKIDKDSLFKYFDK